MTKEKEISNISNKMKKKLSSPILRQIEDNMHIISNMSSDSVLVISATEDLFSDIDFLAYEIRRILPNVNVKCAIINDKILISEESPDSKQNDIPKEDIPDFIENPILSLGGC